MTESDFERWFIDNPRLPNGDRLLVINRHRAHRREVDLLALDETGALVIVEVKAKRTTREAVGQSLEYLADYQDVGLEELEDLYAESNTNSLARDFRKLFDREPNVSQDRRVYLVAPSFDQSSAVCVRHLGTNLLGGAVKYELMQCTPDGDGFSLAPYPCPPLSHARTFRVGSFASTPSGRLYYVLAAGPRPVAWKIGKRISGQGLQLLPTARMKFGCVQIVTKRLVDGGAPSEVDVSQTDTVWRHPNKNGTSARLLGRVLEGTPQTEFAVLARLEAGVFVKFQKKLWTKFSSQWTKTDISLPDWRTIAEAAAERARI